MTPEQTLPRAVRQDRRHSDDKRRSRRVLKMAGPRGVAVIPLYIPLLIAAFFFVLPFIWMASGAFKSSSEITAYPPTFWPNSFTLDNFVTALTQIPLMRYFANSVFVSMFATLGALVSSSLAGFAFAYLRSPRRNIWFGILLATMMLPPFIILIPSYSLYQQLGWLDTYLPLIIPPFLGVGCGFYIFLLRQFFLSVPREIFEAARIDGAGLFRQYWQIALPLAKPALVTVTLFQFVASWNDFFGPLIFLTDSDMYTLPVAIRFFQGLYATDYGPLMAASVISVLPVLLLFLIAQRFFVQGIATTGGKG